MEVSSTDARRSSPSANGKADATGKADPDPHPPTDAVIAGWLALFAEPGQVLELRAPKARLKPGSKRTANVSRFYRDDQLLEMAQEALRLSGRAPGVYQTLNPVDPALLGGARAATDRDVLRRRWLLIDCDPRRPADTSATDGEKAEARAVALAIRDHLRAEGWPDPILADSGNGWHLLYRIDLPADDRELVKRCLHALAARFGTDAVDVDTSVFNPSRIVKCYGTRAAKGEPTPERPHRYSRVVEVPDRLDVVPGELLEALADSPLLVSPGPAPEPPTAAARPSANGTGRGQGAGRWTPEARAVAYLEKCEPAVSGQRGHNQAFKTACNAGPGFGLPEDVFLRLMREAYNPKCDPPWSDRELEHKVRDAYAKETRRGWLLDVERNGHASNGHHAANGKATAAPSRNDQPAAGPIRPNRTDTGNAMRLVAMFGEVIRYCAQWGAWLIWDGTRWKEDTTGQIYRLARKTVQAIGAEAAGAEDADERKAILKWALESENRKRIDAMIALARFHEGIPVETAALDRDRYLLNVENGIVDLRTGHLRPHRPEDLITKLAPVRYDPGAQCLKFLKFLGRIMGDNQELIGFLKRAAGYALTGDVGEHCLFFLHGGGRNGKSTFLGIVQGILGSYATTINAAVMTSKVHDDHPTELCDLDGARFVTTIEVEDGKRMAEALVKSLTGGDPIKARRMRRDPYQFNPTFKLFVAANHKPEIRGTDEGIWSRIKLIPFSVTIPKEERVKNLADLLREEEGPGILNWMIEGCQEWRMAGLAEPGAVTDATAEYRAEMDAIADFIAERCLASEQVRCKNNDLYSCYKSWCERSGVAYLTARKFGSDMERRGFKHKDSNGTRWRLGIAVAQENDESNEHSGEF